MSYQLFKPDRFLCEQGLSSYAFTFKGPTVEFTNPAAAAGIADNVTIPGRYFLSKTVVAYAVKPGLKVERTGPGTDNPSADFDVSWVYGCPHRCVYCQQIYLCKNYPYIAAYPRIERVENAIREIAAYWQENRPFVCEVGRMTDILALEHLTGWLSRLMSFFVQEIAPHGQLKFVTKAANALPLLEIDHRRATRVGISLVPDRQIRSMEPGTAPLSARLSFLTKVISAGYPVHVSFSPVIPTGNFEREYERFFDEIAKALLHGGSPEALDMTADVRLHSVKPESETVVEEIGPHAMNDMVSRRQQGRALLTYPEDVCENAMRFFRRMVPQYLPGARVLFLQ